MTTLPSILREQLVADRHAGIDTTPGEHSPLLLAAVHALLPDAEAMWTGCWNLDSAIVTHEGLTFVVDCEDGEEYLLCVYTTSDWHEGQEPIASDFWAHDPAAVATLLHSITTLQHAGSDFQTWAVQWLLEQSTAD